MRSLKAPDFASRFNVMLYGEPICVLVLCTDQTSKALQIQQVAAATGEIACRGADGAHHTRDCRIDIIHIFRSMQTYVSQFVSQPVSQISAKQNAAASVDPIFQIRPWVRALPSEGKGRRFESCRATCISIRRPSASAVRAECPRNRFSWRSVWPRRIYASNRKDCRPAPTTP